MIERTAVRPTKTRHLVVAAAFALSFVLYLDRAAMAVLAPAVREDLGISPLQMGWIFSAFVWGYALLHVPTGVLGDRKGPRKVLSWIVVLWSAFTAATALAWNLTSMLAIRFLFGAAESGATPNVTRAFARWIPADERARAQGIFFAGMSAGGALAHPLVTVLLINIGWQKTFVVLGFVGLAWAVFWWIWFRDEPSDHPQVNEGELRKIGAELEDKSRVTPLRWREILQEPNLWAILVMYFTYGYTGYIYITWFPTYLLEERQLPAMLAGVLSALPPALAFVAKPIGGWWSDRVTAARGVLTGRRLVGMIGFGLGAAAVVPGIFVANPYLAVLFLGLADAGAALAHGVCFAVCVDIGKKRAGTISALMLTMGSLGNVLSALAFGAFVEFTGSWTPPFLIAGAANLAGCLLWLKIDPRRKLV
jgi:sugar phosphate permease